MSDLIRREDVENTIQRLCDLCGEYERHNGVMCGACNLDNFIRVLDDIPSAEPEQKKGRWIYDTERVMGDGRINRQFHCSLCGDQEFTLYNYCPLCGADMR